MIRNPLFVTIFSALVASCGSQNSSEQDSNIQKKEAVAKKPNVQAVEEHCFDKSEKYTFCILSIKERQRLRFIAKQADEKKVMLYQPLAQQNITPIFVTNGEYDKVRSQKFVTKNYNFIGLAKAYASKVENRTQGTECNSNSLSLMENGKGCDTVGQVAGGMAAIAAGRTGPAGVVLVGVAVEWSVSESCEIIVRDNQERAAQRQSEIERDSNPGRTPTSGRPTANSLAEVGIDYRDYVTLNCN